MYVYVCVDIDNLSCLFLRPAAMPTTRITRPRCSQRTNKKFFSDKRDPYVIFFFNKKRKVVNIFRYSRAVHWKGRHGSYCRRGLLLLLLLLLRGGGGRGHLRLANTLLNMTLQHISPLEFSPAQRTWIRRRDAALVSLMSDQGGLVQVAPAAPGAGVLVRGRIPVPRGGT